MHSGGIVSQLTIIVVEVRTIKVESLNLLVEILDVKYNFMNEVFETMKQPRKWVWSFKTCGIVVSRGNNYTTVCGFHPLGCYAVLSVYCFVPYLII